MEGRKIAQLTQRCGGFMFFLRLDHGSLPALSPSCQLNVWWVETSIYYVFPWKAFFEAQQV